MPEPQPSPQPREPSAGRKTLRQKLWGYQGEIQTIREQLLTENDLRVLLKDAVLVTSYKKQLSTILREVKKVTEKPQAQACFKGIGTFCERIDEAITQLDVALDALDALNKKFDGDIRTQAYNALKKCRAFLEAALEQFLPPKLK